MPCLYCFHAGLAAISGKTFFAGQFYFLCCPLPSQPKFSFMKKLAAALLLLFFTLSAVAQNKEKATAFCSVFAQGKMLSKKFSMRLDLGDNAGFNNFKDPAIKQQLLKVEAYNNPVDVLNFMTHMGWQLVSTVGLNAGGATVGYNFFFKKEMDPDELEVTVP